MSCGKDLRLEVQGCVVVQPPRVPQVSFSLQRVSGTESLPARGRRELYRRLVADPSGDHERGGLMGASCSDTQADLLRDLMPEEGSIWLLPDGEGGRADGGRNTRAPCVVPLRAAFLNGLAIFVNNPSEQFSGIDICQKTGMKSGTVYPLLIKMEENGWLESEWKDIDPRQEGRPKRHFYKITRGGFIQGTKLLEKHRPPIAKPEGHETPILA
jgi:PadR family transcriptional regulator PadR